MRCPWRRSRPADPQESAFAFKRLMQLAASEIANGGEIRPARVIDREADVRKVKIQRPLLVVMADWWRRA